MEKYQELINAAKHEIKDADYHLTMTFKLVQEPRFLFTIIGRILKAMSLAISALLHYERANKAIPHFLDGFDSQLTLFKMKCVNKYDIDKDFLTLISNLQEILQENKESGLTFERKDKFVICSDDYKLKTITAPQVKDHLEKAKLFIQRISLVIEQKGAK
ncbi:MAG: hypothetical protein V1859_08620 [archaeon]